MFELSDKKGIVLIITLSLVILLNSCGLKQEQNIESGDEYIDTSIYKYGICVDSLMLTILQ